MDRDYEIDGMKAEIKRLTMQDESASRVLAGMGGEGLAWTNGSYALAIALKDSVEDKTRSISKLKRENEELKLRAESAKSEFNKTVARMDCQQRELLGELDTCRADNSEHTIQLHIALSGKNAAIAEMESLSRILIAVTTGADFMAKRLADLEAKK